MLGLRVIRVLSDYIEEILVNVIGVVSKEPKDILDTVELRIKDLRVNDKVAINLSVTVLTQVGPAIRA